MHPLLFVCVHCTTEHSRAVELCSSSLTEKHCCDIDAVSFVKKIIFSLIISMISATYSAVMAKHEAWLQRSLHSQYLAASQVRLMVLGLARHRTTRRSEETRSADYFADGRTNRAELESLLRGRGSSWVNEGSVTECARDSIPIQKSLFTLFFCVISGAVGISVVRLTRMNEWRLLASHSPLLRRIGHAIVLKWDSSFCQVRWVKF